MTETCNCPGIMRTGCPCPRCHGAGWYPETVDGTENDYIPDFRERYCDCRAGMRLRERDGVSEILDAHLDADHAAPSTDENPSSK